MRLQHDLGITVSESTVCRTLRHLRLTRKKLTRIVINKMNPANMARYTVFENAQLAMNIDSIVWLDETGLNDLDACRTHGRRGAARSACPRAAARR